MSVCLWWVFFLLYTYRSKLTFWICITKWHFNYSYVTLFFVANIDALCPLSITQVLKATNSWRIVCGCTSWVDLDLSMYAGFTPLTRVDMLIISVYTQSERCWIKYRTISRTVHNFYYCYYHDWMCKAGLSDSYAYLLHVDLWCSDLLWPVILLLQMSYVGQTHDKINLYLDVTMVVRCTMMFMNLMPDKHLVHT